MTRMIRISDATARVIRELAILPFRETGTRQQDGTWLVPVADEIFERIQKAKLPGETDDDALSRIIRNYRGEKPS